MTYEDRFDVTDYIGPRCIAYKDDGTICGALACHIDPNRGGMVCNEHLPHPVPDLSKRAREEGSWP